MFATILKKFTVALLSLILYYYVYGFYKTYLSTSSEIFKTYQTAIDFMSTTLAERTNLNQHHFKPC
jgi:hypothetical protein